MKSLAIIAAIIVLGAAALLRSIDRDTSRAAAPASDPAPGPAARAARALARPPSSAPIPEQPTEVVTDVSSPSSERTAETEIAERRAHLQTRFDGESVDASWAMQSRQQLRDDLGKYTNASVRVRDVECRSSLCRIALASTNRASQQTFVEEWVRHRTWTGSGFAVQDGDATIVYVSKPGVDLAN